MQFRKQQLELDMEQQTGSNCCFLTCIQILKDMGISDHLICLLRNLYAGQEATVRTGHGTTDWFQIGKGVHQAVHCHPAYVT